MSLLGPLHLPQCPHHILPLHLTNSYTAFKAQLRWHLLWETFHDPQAGFNASSRLLQ